MSSPVFRLTVLCIQALSLSLLTPAAFGAPTKVGNGDDGMDLEGAEPVTTGPLSDARAKALELLAKMNVSAVRGLGMLQAEVETSRHFLGRQDANASLSEDHGAFHSDMQGKVYARTFAEPHAVTRFFPASFSLNQSQLVSLEIHEALHRALPASVRQNESIVAALTLSITSPQTSYDQIAATANRLIPEEAQPIQAATAPPPVAYYQNSSTAQIPIPEDARVRQPSLVGYTYRSFREPKQVSLYQIDDMHIIQSFLYPFGTEGTALGLGIEASILRSHGMTQSGPLSLSARMRLWSGRGFDLGAWGVASLNTLSAEELKNSPMGRDVGTIGLSMRKDLKRFYVENFLSYSPKGHSTKQIGQIQYDYTYGEVVNVSAHAGASLSKLKLGLYAEVALADDFQANGGAFSYSSGRYRLISGGPELSWIEKDYSVSVTGKFLLDTTRDASFDTLGDLMGQGISQGNLSASVALFF